MKRLVATSLFLLALALPACSNFAQSNPTAVPILTFTAIPTLTATLAPISTPVPPTGTTDAVAGLVPEGQPVSEWNGILIMPGATAGEGDQDGYVFTIKATPQQIQEYYDLELGKLGWQPFAQGEGDSSMLIFMNNASETLSISIITKEGEALVLLVK